MPYPDTFEGLMVTSNKAWSTFTRRSFTPKTFSPYDIDLRILACGVCGSDVHAITDGWEVGMPLPLCPGHEIIGEVTAIGEKVSTLKVGDRAGVGAQIWACLECERCLDNNENYCPHQVDTYGAKYPDGTITYGGFSSHIRAHEYFTFPIPSSIPTSLAAPMLCAGLTTFSPLKRNNIGPGYKVAVVGIGGLGHFALMWINALGAEAYALSHSPEKEGDAKKMGARAFVCTKTQGWDEEWKGKFDMVLSTADDMEGWDMQRYLGTLNVHGKFWNLGLPDKPLPLQVTFAFMKNGAFFGGSHIGGRKECLEMLNLAAEKGVKSWVEEIQVGEEGCKEAVERLNRNDVRYRFTLVGFDKAFPQ
ncbi:NADPH-dependent medium chain alcohol dehydrogenase [Wilcoxina mikolae CBS 423.85]|nr:NADPH-dependent medium chain alcohol dehydrogenase [Wilcoxina mikolae CBS 423.85]